MLYNFRPRRASGNVFYQAEQATDIVEKASLLKQSISIYPYDGLYWLNYATCLSNPNDRIEAALKAAELNPKNYLGYSMAAIECQKSAQYERAIKFTFDF